MYDRTRGVNRYLPNACYLLSSFHIYKAKFTLTSTSLRSIFYAKYKNHFTHFCSHINEKRNLCQTKFLLFLHPITKPTIRKLGKFQQPWLHFDCHVCLLYVNAGTTWQFCLAPIGKKNLHIFQLYFYLTWRSFKMWHYHIQKNIYFLLLLREKILLNISVILVPVLFH